MELVLVLCALSSAPCGAMIAAFQGRLSPDRAARFAATAGAAGWIAALGLALLRLAAPSTGASANVELIALRVDWLAVLLLVLVLGLSFVIQVFAVRYLRGDSRQLWFVITANLVTASTAVMVCASTVLTFGFSWVAAGASLLALLATYPHVDQAQDGVRRTTVRLLIGDLPLVAAIVVLMIAGGGDVAFADLGDVMEAQPIPVATLVAVLLVIPALARSSQLPFHGWLPATLAAPTPVSALMHAGVVNAGAILVLRFSPTIGESTLAMTLIFCAGALTLVYASAVRLTKPDVKGRLVFSTMAQMGFMMVACGMGAFAAAVFHLVAHGLFKATLFLGAGSGVAREANRRAWPTRRSAGRLSGSMSLTIATAVPVMAILAARMLVDVELSPASQALQLFVVFTAAVALGTALWTHFSLTTVLLGSIGIIALTFGYTSLISAFDRTLNLAPVPAAVSAWWLVAPGAALLALQLTLRSTSANGIARRLYAVGLASGAPTTLTKRQPPIGRRGVPS